MRTLVVYDSVYGNTESIAKAIGAALPGEVRVVRPSEARGNLEGIGLLVVGTPTHGGRPTPDTQEFLDHIPPSALKGVCVAAFDTRLSSRFATLFGYAAGKVAASLESKGGSPTASPEGFIVRKTKGPLLEGETDRAAAWGKAVGSKCEAAAH